MECVGNLPRPDFTNRVVFVPKPVLDQEIGEVLPRHFITHEGIKDAYQKSRIPKQPAPLCVVCQPIALSLRACSGASSARRRSSASSAATSFR